ncbi:DEKNAAC102878 [Brettanomyces naardenensis]|uniref:IMP-specific 5'-nucleotidase 1 n=1 Tax=Brettanomyces naardenensis TaxID=13370 RepID=A0A448YLL6_BRENA|nr:DEKNAAC102878 [Brettanomyces naardenensis]
MTSRYRVDYALKEHRRDEFIQFIKGLLATPFVLYAVKPAGTISDVEELMIDSEAKRRYAEIFHDLENLVENHIEMTKAGIPKISRLHQLVPSIGTFFTPLPLEKAFYIEDERRSISKRRLVAPSFNDIRLILNTAQVLRLATTFQNGKSRYLTMKGHPGGGRGHQNDDCERLQLVTFDGDITLYNDGENLQADSPLILQLISLMSKDICIGIVTAAGYLDAEKYYERLGGLVDAVKQSELLTDSQRENMLVVGGEANYMFRYSNEVGGFSSVDRDEWMLRDMKDWTEDDITESLDFAGKNLARLMEKLALPAQIIRKERSVGMVPLDGCHLIREQLEEVVLRIDRDMKRFEAAQKIKWCAFNGGADVWVDIGDKAYGVRILQSYLSRSKDETIGPVNTLHVGDQFASLGANDYASRTAAATAWVSSPRETYKLLKDLLDFMDDWATY